MAYTVLLAVVEVYPMDADETETLVFEGMVSMSADDQPQVDTIAIPMMTLANIAEGNTVKAV